MKIDVLLYTKLNYPRLPDGLVSRPHLLERLNRGLDRKFTLICAPAGYGKSTLAASCLETCSRPVAWLTLDETDNDMYRFLTYVVAAIQTIFPNGCAQTLNLLQAPPRVRVSGGHLDKRNCRLGRTLLVILGVLVANSLAENIIAPKLIGKGLSVSPLVVFLSFFFWSWILGPLGMFLSMPLTVIVLMVLDSFDETRWVARTISRMPAVGDGNVDPETTEA